jgi:hypothetical protein
MPRSRIRIAVAGSSRLVTRADLGTTLDFGIALRPAIWTMRGAM